MGWSRGSFTPSQREQDHHWATLKAHSSFSPGTWCLPGCCAQAGISALKSWNCPRSEHSPLLTGGPGALPRVHILSTPSTWLSMKCNYLFSFPLLPQLLPLDPTLVSSSPCFCSWRRNFLFFHMCRITAPTPRLVTAY